MSTLDELAQYANHNLNVLLIGSHGIGKTVMVEQVAENLGVQFKYYSASTLDPWADLVGIPVPDKETKTLDFYRPASLEAAEFIFFDELNRAHPRVLNAVLEIIQFKKINGVPLPNLKMIWAAINPIEEGYSVEEIDPALFDRFHVYFNLKAEFNVPYMKTKMHERTMNALKLWWRTDMDEIQRKIVSPRRLEYIGYLIDNGLDWRKALPTGALPTKSLDKRLRMFDPNDPRLNITKESILKNIDLYATLALEDPGACIKMINEIKFFSEQDLFLCRNILENMKKDLVFNMGRNKFPMIQEGLYETFEKNNVDAKLLYPKIYEAFKFAEYEDEP